MCVKVILYARGPAPFVGPLVTSGERKPSVPALKHMPSKEEMADFLHEESNRHYGSYYRNKRWGLGIKLFRASKPAWWATHSTILIHYGYPGNVALAWTAMVQDVAGLHVPDFNEALARRIELSREAGDTRPVVLERRFVEKEDFDNIPRQSSVFEPPVSEEEIAAMFGDYGLKVRPHEIPVRRWHWPTHSWKQVATEIVLTVI